MDLITTKKYSLRQHPYYRLLGLAVALVDANSENRSFYRQKLEQAHMLVEDYQNLAELQASLPTAEFRVVVYSPNTDELEQELRILRGFISSNPKLPVVTIAKTMQELQLDAIMKLGIRLHINRDLSHPRDLLIALEQVV